MIFPEKPLISGNILIVDDKPYNLILLSTILAEEGHKVRKVTSGELALEAAQLDPPDLILLDIMMPEPNGFEVCKRLKASEVTQGIPIIFLSALDALHDKVKAFTVGGVDYVAKPFQAEEVCARVQIHLKLRAFSQLLEAKNQSLQAEIEQRKAAERDLKQVLDQLKTAQMQMIATEKLASLGTLIAGIAHEIRNPLNFVNNYAEGSTELIDDLIIQLQTHAQHIDPGHFAEILSLAQDVQENAITIHRHGQRAEHIIQQMMQYARAEVIHSQPTDLNALLAEATQLTYYSKRAQDLNLSIVIETDYDPTIGRMDLVPNDLTRAFINLLDNAYDALKSKKAVLKHQFSPSLKIRTQKLKNNVEIRIRDNGIGIPMAILPKIFDPFFTSKPPGQGTGLGLSIAHNIIVGEHKGSLRLESEANVYTECIITLP